MDECTKDVVLNILSKAIEEIDALIKKEQDDCKCY